MIPLPEPPLRSGALELRPWHAEDVQALVAAWADPEIQRWNGVPEVRDRAAAARWIAGDDLRRQGWLSLDLVVQRDGGIVGEVGLSSFDREARTAEVGWWTAAEHRGQGIASVAARLLIGWAHEVLHLASVSARYDDANPASAVVAQRSGAKVLI